MALYVRTYVRTRDKARQSKTCLCLVKERPLQSKAFNPEFRFGIYLTGGQYFILLVS